MHSEPQADEANDFLFNHRGSDQRQPQFNEIKQLRLINRQLEGESEALKQLLITEKESKAVALSALQSKLVVLSNRVEELKQTAQRIPVPSEGIEVTTVPEHENNTSAVLGPDSNKAYRLNERTSYTSEEFSFVRFISLLTLPHKASFSI